MKQAQLAESFGVDVHGGDPHVIRAIKNDPIFEAMGVAPLAVDAELNCKGTLVVEDGYMSIAWRSQPVEDLDWDEIEKNVLAII